MIAQAPGKVVVSGAYSVLQGSPAVVVAVDRYVTADASRPADFVTPEVRAALGDARAPWFDASSLRDSDRKLGLGSSAAILVASLAAVAARTHGPLEDERLVEEVFEPALVAHRSAQGGGSGIDVAASCHGGCILATRGGDGLEVTSFTLPRTLTLEVWAAGHPASTAALLGHVRELERRDPQQHRALLNAQGTAAAAAAEALRDSDASRLVEALAEQCACLDRLGKAATAPIVTTEVRALNEAARTEYATVLPSGAGGGDIALYAGLHAPSPALRARAAHLGHTRLDVRLEARGVHLSVQI